MGYAGGSSVFNAVARAVLKEKVGEEVQYRVLKAVWEALEDEDWDTQDEVDPKTSTVVKRLYREWLLDWDDDSVNEQGWWRE